ncbi:MAG: DMT family transporter [Marinilabiliales bacterium]
MNKKIPVYLLLVFSMLIWGISYIFLEVLYEYFTPLTVASLRVIIACIFMLSLSLIFKKLQKVDKKDLLLIILFAFFDPFLYFLCESYGLLHTNPVTASVIIATIPLFTPMAAIIFTNEKLRLLNYIGIVVSFIGVILVIIKPDFTLAVKLTGVLLLFGAVFCAVSYNFFMKTLTNKYNVYTIITVQNIFSSVFFLPLLIFYDGKKILSVNYSLDIVAILLILAVFASALAFIFYANAIRVIGITKTNVFTNMIPVFTAVFAYLILKETVSFVQLSGILMVVTGLFLSQKAKKP